MSHELEIRSGKAQMFSVKETPWHKLGHIIHEAPTIEEGIRLAGLDWTVSPRKLQIVNDDGTVPRIDTDKFRAFVRDDTSDVFAVLTKEFTPFQNVEAFKFFQPFIDSGEATLETAGSLRGGRRVWVLAKLCNAPIEVGKGDPIMPFLLLSNGHDGSMALRIGFTPIRVVCANTMAAAHGENQSRLIRIAHSKDVSRNADLVQDIISASKAQFEATTEQYKLLARKKVNTKDVKNYVRIVFDTAKIEDDDRRKLREDRLMADIERLFTQGRGSNLATAKGTAWGLYNSVAEMLSYERSRTDDARLESLWFGDAFKLNQKALDAAFAMVG